MPALGGRSQAGTGAVTGAESHLSSSLPSRHTPLPRHAPELSPHWLRSSQRAGRPSAAGSWAVPPPKPTRPFSPQAVRAAAGVCRPGLAHVAFIHSSRCTGASIGVSRAPSAGCARPPGWQPGSSRGSQVSVDLHGVQGGLPQHPDQTLLPSWELFVTVSPPLARAGPDGLSGAGQAGEAGALVATEGRVAVGGSSGRKHAFRLLLPPASCPPVPLLCISAWLSPRMPALPLSSGGDPR